MTELKLIQIGNSVGVVIPKEVLAALNLDKGDTLFATKTPGGLNLTATDPDLEEELKLGREFMKRYRDTFKALAK